MDSGTNFIPGIVVMPWPMHSEPPWPMGTKKKLIEYLQPFLFSSSHKIIPHKHTKKSYEKMMSQTTTTNTTTTPSSLRFFHCNECSYEKCKMKNLLKKSRRATSAAADVLPKKTKKQVRFEDSNDDATATTFNSSFNSLSSTGSDHSNYRWSCDESTKDNLPVMCKPRASIEMTPVDLPLFEILFELEEENEANDEEESSFSSFAEDEPEEESTMELEEFSERSLREETDISYHTKLTYNKLKKNRRYRTSKRLTNNRNVAPATN